MDFERLFSRSADAMRPSPIRHMASLVSQPGVISFAGGMPNPETFPSHDMKAIMDEIAERDGARVFQYGMTRGLKKLCEAVAEILAGRGIAADPSQILITGGSQQGLDLLSRVLIDPGDTVLVELPSYTGALACFRNSQAEMVGVRQDGDGVVTGDLEDSVRTLKRDGKKIKLLYLIPNFQNPSGATLSPERRSKVLDIAREHGFLVVEDDPYGELYFQGVDPRDLRALKSLPDSEHVVYLGSFSKVVSPGLRTGFMAAPEKVARMAELAKQAADLCGSSLDQALVYEYCKRGLFSRHLCEVRAFYQRKSSAMTEAMDRHMRGCATWARPKGGMFVWVTLPAGADAEALSMEAIREVKVGFIHGSPFFVDGSGANTLRLTFAKESEEKIEEGVRLLGGFFRDRL